MGMVSRRRVLLGSAGVIGGSTALGRLSRPVRGQSAQRWPGFQYDDANSGHAPENTGPVGDVEQSWAVETGDEVWSSPVVAGGTVYVGSLDGNVYALDATDGSERWVFGTDGAVGASPTVAMSTVVIGRRTVYVGSRTVYALDATDGTEQWSFEPDATVASSPVMADGTVYVGSNDNAVYALDATEGGVEWTFQTGDSVQSSPAVVDGTVYVGSNDDAVYALDAADGGVEWTFETGGVVQSSPAVVDGIVYVGSWDDNVYAVDAADGTERWRFEAGTDVDVSSSPAVVDETVYVGGGGSDNVYALDAADGTEQWRWETGEVYSSPAVVDGTVYIGSYDGDVYALDASVGPDAEHNPFRERWTIGTDGEVFSSPAVVDGTVYVGSKDNRLYAFTGETPTSTPTETAPTDGGPNEPPTASITARPSDPEPGETVTFDASGSADADGSITSYEWQITVEAGGGGGGRSASGPTVDATLPSDGGAVRAELTVTDDDGAADTTERTVSSDGAGAVPSENGADSFGELPLLVGAGTLGAAGGAWWYRRRRRADVDGEESADGSTGGSAGATSPGAVSGSGSPGASPSSREGSATGQSAPPRPGSGAVSGGDTERPADSERPDGHPERRHAGSIPDAVPRAPTLSVDYDALRDEEPIGGGGNADVTKATLATPTGDVTLAIKRPRMSGTLHADAVDRLLREAETWDKLDDHDHVVGVVDYGSEPIPWIAMEYMDGGHLGDRRGQMDTPQALWTAIAITRGVRHAHRRGVAHLDLKPENVLFRTVEDAWDVPKVADWGLSKHLLDHSTSVEGLSTHYAAPEQFEENGPADDITDIYQLGAVFYELFTGRPPFEGQAFAVIEQIKNSQPPPPSERADVPEAVDDVLLRALAKDRRDRYENIVLLRNDLEDAFGAL